MARLSHKFINIILIINILQNKINSAIKRLAPPRWVEWDYRGGWGAGKVTSKKRRRDRGSQRTSGSQQMIIDGEMMEGGEEAGGTDGEECGDRRVHQTDSSYPANDAKRVQWQDRRSEADPVHGDDRIVSLAYRLTTDAAERLRDLKGIMEAAVWADALTPSN